MDPVTLAATAVAVLAPYLPKMAEGVAKKAGEMAVESIAPLYQLIREKFSSHGDAAAQAALMRLSDDPASQPERNQVAEAIQHRITDDPVFGAKLDALIQELSKRDPVIRQLAQSVMTRSAINIAGEAQVGAAVVMNTAINPTFGGSTFQTRERDVKK
jgi:hypothetical protein